MKEVTRYSFPAESATLERIGELVGEAAGKAGFTQAEIGDIAIAMDEACTNTITHGLKEDPNQNWELEIQTGEGEISFIIREYGAPFDPTKVKKPDVNASLEERDIGGLGVYFVEQLMDEVNYDLSDDGLKTITMVKRKKTSDES